MVGDDGGGGHGQGRREAFDREVVVSAGGWG